MVSFFILGCIVTVSSLFLFFSGLQQGQFLFGPFIAMIIGMNFLLISFVQMKREKAERNRGKVS
ncbi:hypothetical protein [Halalkalibacter akibai]|uniref:Uncharacterized protein n=1 Tax=Halalkalibacter akibai (strain ATCC 43226 / DSM 21942 / CIP 109018 / JCM 9157 / 1139) TaxID=1236973 RepID=W4QZI6_HALA3|nr:hypothetical protein [Halalkalibacter akibai]GAE37078.1 hypothetical protein JCM9157_4322 [Halalkalibacter akibai JCM 9157]